MNSYAYKLCKVCNKETYTNIDICDCGGELILDPKQADGESLLEYK